MQLLGEGSGGVWRRRDALKVCTAGVVKGQVYDGHWFSPYPSVFTDGGKELSPEQWAFAGVLASGGELPTELDPLQPVSQLGALACARDAARVWTIPLIDDDDPATGALDRLKHDVAVWKHLRPLRTRTLAPDDEQHELRRHRYELEPSDVVRLDSGLWLTSRVRTLFDLTLVISHEALVCAIDAMLHREEVTIAELEAYAAKRTDQYAARLLLAALEVADGRAESVHETLTRLLLKPHWPELQPQVELIDGLGRVVARFDHADEELMLAVESDGKRYHAGEVSAARDKGRDRRTESYGWWTERVTWWEVRCRQEQTCRRVLAARDRRRRSLAA